VLAFGGSLKENAKVAEKVKDFWRVMKNAKENAREARNVKDFWRALKNAKENAKVAEKVKDFWRVLKNAREKKVRHSETRKLKVTEREKD
jgi:hypothetical protein